MAHEIKPWKEADCELVLKTNELTDRKSWSEEINAKFGEGGGLNADYRDVEAIAIVASILGRSGLQYGQDFVWKTVSDGEFGLDFASQAKREVAVRALCVSQAPGPALTIRRGEDAGPDRAPLYLPVSLGYIPRQDNAPPKDYIYRRWPREEIDAKARGGPLTIRRGEDPGPDIGSLESLEPFHDAEVRWR